MTRNACRRSLS